MQVWLKYWTNRDPLLLASEAAHICYKSELPNPDLLKDVEKELFLKGHHTTCEHMYLTFAIEGISVSDVTFGLHLSFPFYNSDQRSGRFCSSMFTEADPKIFTEYLTMAGVLPEEMDEILSYIQYGMMVYRSNLTRATAVTTEFLKEERPNASPKYIEDNAPKIGQEQLRMFIPTVFPTALMYTIDLVTLAALWESAWSPTLRAITDQMVACVLEQFPTLVFMFRAKKRTGIDWWPKVGNDSGVLYAPTINIDFLDSPEKMILPSEDDAQPVDKFHFLPQYMDNSVLIQRSTIEISVATMGQDQRHRTIQRGTPQFTGHFYVPPVVRTLGLEKEVKELMAQWRAIIAKRPSLTALIAPYGAMVSYRTLAEFNALAHKQAKRLCGCAQEENYNLSLENLHQITLLRPHYAKNLIDTFLPPCIRTGICPEGVRCCGKSQSLSPSDFLTPRKV
jgi:hypothetical protein